MPNDTRGVSARPVCAQNRWPTPGLARACDTKENAARARRRRDAATTGARAARLESRGGRAPGLAGSRRARPRNPNQTEQERGISLAGPTPSRASPSIEGATRAAIGCNTQGGFEEDGTALLLGEYNNNNNQQIAAAFSKSPPHLMSLPPLSVSFAQHAPKSSCRACRASRGAFVR